MRTIGINVNTTKDKDESVVNAIKDIISSKLGAEILIFKDSKGLTKEKCSKLDFIIALGGDGTILSTARKVSKYGIPILGVNIGTLGFLAAVEMSQFEDAMMEIKDGSYSIEDRVMIGCERNFRLLMIFLYRRELYLA